MSKYWQLLKDPRWQKRRLEVLDRDEFSCQECGATEKTLHVHHMYYERGKNPWEYPDEALRTVCEDCHVALADKQLELAQAVSRMSRIDIDAMIGFAVAFRALCFESGLRLTNQWQRAGFRMYYDVTEEELAAFLDADTGALDSEGIYEFALAKAHAQREAKPR